MRCPGALHDLTRVALTALILLPARLVAGGPGAATGNGTNLFDDAPAGGSRPRAVAAEDQAVRSRRRVRVRRELLQTPAAVMAPLRFNLFPGAEFTAVPERDERTADGDRVLAGRLAGAPDSQFLLVVHGEEVVADVFVSPLERYQLRREPGEDGAPEVRRLDPRAVPPCGGGPVEPLRGQPGLRPRSAGGRLSFVPAPRPRDFGGLKDTDDPGAFDVLIAYTPAARNAAGGAYSIEAQARLAVEGINQRYQNSGIATRARLARTLEVPYVEAAGGVFEDLNHLLNDASGPLADVRSARDAAAADVACLFLAAPTRPPRGGFFIGAATFAVDLGDDGQPYGVPGRAFSAVLPAYDVSTTFAHEVGHNFGCQHDVENITFQGVNYGPGIFPFSYGYRFTGLDGQLYRDVMAYDPGLAIPYFANPGVLYAGAPTGTAAADNARTINATAPLIANLLRPVKVGVFASDSLAVERPLRPGRFTVRRTGSTAAALTVNLDAPVPVYSTLPQASPIVQFRDQFFAVALPGVDYTPLPRQVVLPAGQAAVDVTMTPVDDGVPQHDRLVLLRALPGDGYTLDPRQPDTQQAGIIIRANATTLSVHAADPVAVRDPLAAGRFTFTRTGPLDEPLAVIADIHSEPSATFLSARDYTLVPAPTGDPARWTIPAGAAELDVAAIPTTPAPVLKANLAGPVRHVVTVTLRETDAYGTLVPSAQVSLADRPAVVDYPTLVAFAAPSVPASLRDGSPGELVLVRTGAADQGQSVFLNFRGTALTGVDFQLQPLGEDVSASHLLPTSNGNGSAYFPPGVSLLRLAVLPVASGDEHSRSALVTIAPDLVGGYGVDPAAASVAVVLLGSPVLTVTATGPEARATSDLGPVYGEFTLRREGDLSAPLTARYAVAGSAAPGRQYKALPGVATFPAGQDLVRVKVKPKGDAGGPGAKSTVKLALSPGEGYVLSDTPKAKVKVLGGGGNGG